MVTISLCMIVKNEENTLANCLDSVRDIVDEIIIVDTGSSDNTKDIALKYTDKVYDFQWIDDFATARNYSFSFATMDFILWLDADDVILDEDRENFKLLKSDLTLNFDVVILKYVLKRDEAGKEVHLCYRERLLRRGKGYKWNDKIHEYISFFGDVILHTEIAVTHTKKDCNAKRNLEILKKIIYETNEAEARHYFYYARESNELGDTEEALKYYLKFLEMKNDAFSHFIESCIQLAGIYMQRNQKKEALRILLRSFEYGPMRAEVLCLIGHYYIEEKDYKTAIAWLELVLSLTKPAITWQLMLPEYWGFLPCIELCHCYYMLGDFSKSIEYHKRAKELKPYDSVIIQNDEFFASINNQNIQSV